jgi:hypothetical protein
MKTIALSFGVVAAIKRGDIVTEQLPAVTAATLNHLGDEAGALEALVTKAQESRDSADAIESEKDAADLSVQEVLSEIKTSISEQVQSAVKSAFDEVAAKAAEEAAEEPQRRAAAEKANKEEAKVVAEAAAAPYLKLVEEAKTRAREYQDAATAKAMECQGLGSSAVAQANEANVFCFFQNCIEQCIRNFVHN